MNEEASVPEDRARSHTVVFLTLKCKRLHNMNMTLSLHRFFSNAWVPA